MDQNKYSIILVSLEASVSEGAYLTNAGYQVTYGGNTYSNEEGLEVDLPNIGHSLGSTEGEIKGVKISGVFLTQLSNNYPFSSIAVKIRELDIDADTDAVDAERILFDGLVYQASPAPLTGYMQIVIRDWKYYTDITAGVPCTEMCAWGALGGKGCGAAVVSEEHIVDSIISLRLSISEDLTGTTAFLFNKGYIEYGAARIKIKYHESGRVFQMAKAPPSSWVGKAVTIYSGCDRQLSTCKNIYDNEVNFLGLGYAMVDYNPFYENP